DPYVGRVNVFKVMSGKVLPDAVLTNGRTVGDERLHQLLTLRGREQEPVSEVSAGDIAAVAKLNDTSTGDVLAQRGGGFEFSDAIVGGSIPRQFIPAVERGIADTIVNGGALGFPVVDV